MLPQLMIGDYLFVSKFSYGFSRYSLPFHPINFGGRILGSTPERGDVVVFRHPGEDDGSRQARDRPARRYDRGARRRRDPERPAAAAPAHRRLCHADQPQQPLQGAAPARSAMTARDGRRADLPYPRFRETLPGGRSYDVLDQSPTAIRDTFGPDPGARGPALRHGRQSRRQPRQPLRPPSDGIGRRPAPGRQSARQGRWSPSGRPTARPYGSSPGPGSRAARWDRLG